MPSVLILGGRAPVAADHARRFAHQGWTAYIGDSIPCRLSGWSRAAAGTFALAPPRSNPARFIADLRAVIERHAIDLVVPTCEEVFFLSRYRHALPASCRIAADDFAKLRLLHSKWDFQAPARECNGNVPASALVRSIAEARAWAGGMPIVLKPEFSRFGVHVRIHPQGIPDHAPELPEQGRWVAQHHCAGTELCSYSIADRGRLLAHAVYRPGYRLRRSASYYFDGHASPAIFAFVQAFVAKLAFTGQISFDWIDSGDGRPSVIECNPRATSGLHLFAMSDALPAALNGEAADCIMPSAFRPRMLAPVMLTAGFGQALLAGKLRQWRRDFQAARDVLTTDGDTRPLLGGLLDMASYAKLAFQQGCTMREAATRDIEWDGECLEPL
jgi:hypothetical protein